MSIRQSHPQMNAQRTADRDHYLSFFLFESAVWNHYYNNGLVTGFVIVVGCVAQ